MRSRYTAHVRGDAGYLSRSRCAETRVADAITPLDPSIRWQALRVLRTEAGGADDAEGLVEFIARYKQHGRAGRLHEVSRFRRIDAGWCYLDGEPGSAPPQPSPGSRRRR